MLKKTEVPVKKFEITDDQVLYLANPSHKACHGLGYVGRTPQGFRILCSCVHRALRDEGKTPWLARKERMSKKEPS